MSNKKYILLQQQKFTKVVYTCIHFIYTSPCVAARGHAHQASDARAGYLHRRGRRRIAEFALESTGPAALVFRVLHQFLRLTFELQRLVVAALLVELLGLEHGLFGLAHVLLGFAVVLLGLLLELLALAVAERSVRCSRGLVWHGGDGA